MFSAHAPINSEYKRLSPIHPQRDPDLGTQQDFSIEIYTYRNQDHHIQDENLSLNILSSFIGAIVPIGTFILQCVNSQKVGKHALFSYTVQYLSLMFQIAVHRSKVKLSSFSTVEK